MKNTISNKIMNICFTVLVAVFSTFAFVPQKVSAKGDTLAVLAVFRQPSYLSFAAVPSIATDTLETIDNGLEVDDRAKRIDAYYEKRNMPLAGYGEQFVKIAEKCDIDWRLLPAIGVRESSGGKNQFNNNPFGWGSAKIKFKDFSEAIEVVSDNLCGLNKATARYYKDRTTYERLWYYNGTVIRSYPDEVIAIMEMI